MATILPVWRKFTEKLATIEPALVSALQPGVTAQSWTAFEGRVALPLPRELRDLYTANDGEGGNAPTGLFFGCRLLPLSFALSFWAEWQVELEAGYIERDVPADARIGEEFPSLTHLPVFTDENGNFIGLDLLGGVSGTPGQVIVFGADYLDTRWLCASLTDLITAANEVLDSGTYVLRRDPEMSFLPWMELDSLPPGPLSRWQA